VFVPSHSVKHSANHSRESLPVVPWPPRVVTYIVWNTRLVTSAHKEGRGGACMGVLHPPESRVDTSLLLHCTCMGGRDPILLAA
jgi:hypothetical protein